MMSFNHRTNAMLLAFAMAVSLQAQQATPVATPAASPGVSVTNAVPAPAPLTYLSPGKDLLQSAESMPYKKTPQEELKIYILRPSGSSLSKPLPAIVYFTGGGWVKGAPEGMIQNAQWWREQGIIGIVADYRVKSRHGTTPLECVKDAKSALRFVRKNASQLGIDPNRIIAGGGSAGGHIAAATFLPGNDEIGEDLSISTRPNALELHNPALGAGFGKDFFDAHPDCSPLLGVGPGWPPTILSNGTADDTTPPQFAEEFTAKMKVAGNACEYIPIQNAKHSCDWPSSNRNFLPTMKRMAEFFREHGIVPPSTATN